LSLKGVTEGSCK